jgi:poly(3-hydroxybutyrate) depolymerase
MARDLRTYGTGCGFALALVLASDPAGAAERLGRYPVDPEKVSISGISSGAFMANQFHIAHSALIMGAGIVAGGLYGCAVHHTDGDKLVALSTQAVGACMLEPDELKDVEAYAQRTRELARRGWIDSLEGLKGDRVYVFTGSSDEVVKSEVVRRGADLYGLLGVSPKDLKLVRGEAGHSWVTMNYGVACDANKGPYINACGYDQAGDMLQHIYGELRPAATILSGKFVEFSQAEFAPDPKPAEHGLSEVGYLYAPKACAPGRNVRCALHIALHGCMQSAESLRDEFYKNVGLNEWADSNHIIVLYPQAHAISAKDFANKRITDLFETNHAGCWNWFGYGYDEHFALTSGVQVTALYKMIRRIMGEN